MFWKPLPCQNNSDKEVNCFYNKLENNVSYSKISFRKEERSLHRPLHLVIIKLLKMLCNEVENTYRVKFVTSVLFLVLAFHTFEVHGTLYTNGLRRYGYVVIR